MTRRPIVERFNRAILRPPFSGERCHKGWLERWSKAQPHLVRRIALEIAGWPRFEKPQRIVFIADLHVGSHAGDIDRFAGIMMEAAGFAPDLILFGGDYVNMSTFGGGRIPPHVIASLMGRAVAPLGRFAVLGNHDYIYGARDVASALRDAGITLLDHDRRSVEFRGETIDILGLPDTYVGEPDGQPLNARLRPARPSIVLAHDPAWFAHMPEGPYLMLAGHTHGGQIRLPGIGILTNASRAPRHWSHGLIIERNRHLYVTAGLGTSGLPLRIGVPPEYAVLDLNGTM